MKFSTRGGGVIDCFLRVTTFIAVVRIVNKTSSR